MTSRELVKLAIYFRGPDRIPHFLPDENENDILWHWTERPEPVKDWTNYGDVDRMTDCWGTTFQRVKDGRLGRGEVYEPAISDISRQIEYKFPDGNNPRYAQKTKIEIKKNNSLQNPKYCLGVGCFASLNEGTHNLMGLENMFVSYYENPDGLKSLISRLAEKQHESIHMFSDAGCDGVMFYDDWGLQDRLMVSRDLIEEFFMPFYRKNWKYAHDLGMDVWLHSCGYIIDILPMFIDAGLNVIQMDQQENMGLENLAESVGGRLAFWCPVDIQQTMANGSEKDIENYVKEMIRTLGGFKGGFISMAYSTPEDINHTPEKINVMCRAFRKYGSYK